MTQKLSTTKIQFIDLEMQCWEDAIVPLNQSSHIIQIGIVEIDTEKLSISRKENYFIRPKNKNFEITQYCTDLTGITHDILISHGRRFNDVMNTLRNEFSPRNKVTYAWGSDNDAITQHCKEYSCDNPWGSTGIWI